MQCDFTEQEKNDYEKIIDIFESQIREKYLLPEGLVQRWFDSAVEWYSLEIKPVSYDSILKKFTPSLPVGAGYTLGLIVAQQYLKREISRLGKLNNIIGRDLQLNAVSASKSATKAEYDTIYAEIEELIHKQKVHAYN